MKIVTYLILATKNVAKDGTMHNRTGATTNASQSKTEYSGLKRTH